MMYMYLCLIQPAKQKEVLKQKRLPLVLVLSIYLHQSPRTKSPQNCVRCLRLLKLCFGCMLVCAHMSVWVPSKRARPECLPQLRACQALACLYPEQPQALCMHCICRRIASKSLRTLMLSAHCLTAITAAVLCIQL